LLDLGGWHKMAFENTTIIFADLFGVFLEQIVIFFSKMSSSYILILFLFMIVGLIFVLMTKFKEVRT